MPTERVLVVDDDPAILMLCHRILEADGYAVVDAKRGEEALARLETESFDLLLTDIRLPGLNGLDVTGRLRERGLELSVVTMTGYSNMEMAIQALSLGVEEFIVKPFTPDTLRLHVSRALEKGRLRRELARLRTLVPLLDSAQRFASDTSRDQVYAELFSSTQRLLAVDELAVLIPQPENQSLKTLAVHGKLLEPLQDAVLTLSQIADSGDAFSTPQLWSQSEQPRLPRALLSSGWLVAVPLLANGGLCGVLISVFPAKPSPGDVEMLQLICAQAAAALQNTELLAESGRAYQRVLSSEKLKSEFTSSLGNELRKQLEHVRENTEQLHLRLDGETRKLAARILAQAARAQQVADELVGLKYLEGKELELHPEHCSMGQAVSRVVNAYRPLALARDQSIDIQIDEHAGAVVADRALLDLILGGLISTVIEMSSPATKVQVAAGGDADFATVIVQNRGKAGSLKQATRIPDIAPQGVRGLENLPAGLGLSMTRAMIRAQGGKIWVESQEDRSNALHLSLPRSNNTLNDKA